MNTETFGLLRKMFPAAVSARSSMYSLWAQLLQLDNNIKQPKMSEKCDQSYSFWEFWHRHITHSEIELPGSQLEVNLSETFLGRSSKTRCYAGKRIYVEFALEPPALLSDVHCKIKITENQDVAKTCAPTIHIQGCKTHDSRKVPTLQIELLKG